MDVVLVAASARDRWALVDELGLSPRAGADREAGLARVVHPAARPTDVVLLVRDDDDLAWLRRLRLAPAGTLARVVAVVADVDPVLAVRAGADAVLARGGSSPLADEVRAALDRARRLPLVVIDAPQQVTS